MIEQSFMDKLLDRAKVEWKELQHVAVKVSSGGTPRTSISEYYYGEIPWLRTQEIDFKEIWDTSVKITESGLKNSSAKLIPANCVIVAMYGATVGKVGINKIPLATNQACANIQLNAKVADYRYVFHYLTSKYDHIKSLGTGSQTNINAKIVKKYPIPVPPLKVQEEIVRILDTLTESTTELITELKKELTAHKKQYSYYRDKLFAFEDGEVEWKALGDVVLPTHNIKWKETNGTYKYIDLSSVCRNKNIIIETTEITAENAPSRAKKVVAKDDVIFATTRPTQQRLCLINERYSGEVASTGYCVLRAKKNQVLPKWMYYCITSSKFKKYVEDNQSGSAYPAISDKKVKEFKIPAPIVSEQERIVSMLEKYEVLTNSIIEELSREIELSEKQYEYYRNMLLSFPKE